MKHGMFLTKFASYLPVWEFHRKEPRQGFKDTANNFSISPMLAANRVRFVDSHKKDPKFDLLADETHSCVCSLALLVNLESPETMRKDLVDKFRCSPDAGPAQRWPKDIRKSSVKKLLVTSGLKWFEFKGVPFVHWTEQ